LKTLKSIVPEGACADAGALKDSAANRASATREVQ
jgi:hypothetical protein